MVVVLQNTLFDYLKLDEKSKGTEDIIFLVYKNDIKGLQHIKTCTVSLDDIISRSQNTNDVDLISIINKKMKMSQK